MTNNRIDVTSNKHVRRALAAFSALIAFALATGCGSSPSEAGSAGSPSTAEPPTTTDVSPGEAASVLRQAKKAWRKALDANALADPETLFDNPTEGEFLARLSAAADKHGFAVVQTEWLEPLQAAPLVVVESDDPTGLARSTPAILRSLDPQVSGGEDWEGWAFEGFFFEARDEDGVPFLAVFNSFRGSNPGGGQWARSEDLYAYEHG